MADKIGKNLLQLSRFIKLSTFTSSVKDMMVIRGCFDESEDNFLQVVLESNPKRLRFIKCVNGTETTIFTVTGS